MNLTHLRTLDAPTGLALIPVADSGANARLSPAPLPADLSGFTHLLLRGELPPAATPTLTCWPTPTT